MDLEFLLRAKPDWRAELKEILFTKGSIVKAGERGEKKPSSTDKKQAVAPIKEAAAYACLNLLGPAALPAISGA